jgi:adenosylcobinamide kinase/adenosylcobinamide-phosphate guanylyltransferase
VSAKKVILIGGGPRSGKSSFALALARRTGGRRLFLATGQAGDEEMRQRIDRHRQTRGDDFATLEEPLAIPEVFERPLAYDVVVLDCLTLWLSNLLLEGREPEAVLRRVEDLADVLAHRKVNVLIVTNEVGLGIIPETTLGRIFRDVTGLAHQRLSAVADEVYFSALGIMLRIKPTLAVVPSEESRG